ncbi:MAG: tandem-95 repeat protein, partial [Gammaproteobacteria bacterium]|nr:tandem-95 repeat protein [Gammaproteobacteria bacterium]
DYEVTLTATDEDGNFASYSFTVTVTDVNDLPVANDDATSVAEGGNVVIDVRANDTDAETATSSLTITNIGTATNGTLVNNNDGTVTYTHDGSETTSDSFTYTVNDGDSDSATVATVNISVTAVNDLPVANDDEALVAEGGNVVIDVRANDTDAETATLSLTIANLGTATNGTLVNNNDGTVTYTHDGSETTSDSFTYTINDGVSDSAAATVTITLTAVNDPPVANDDTASVGEGGNVVINVRTNDTDVETATSSLTIT